MMTDYSDMPVRIWVTHEEFYHIGKYRKFHASDLDHGEEYVDYIRADIPTFHASAVAALERLVNAKALSGVRALVAGWNGEGRPEPYSERHPSRLGATLPKTNCGAVYDLDEAMQHARQILALARPQTEEAQS